MVFLGEKKLVGEMTYELSGGFAPDYFPCRYGSSRLVVRGPCRELEGDYIAVLGSTDTYGKFIETPYPSLTEEALGVPCVNFGCVNAGVDAFVNDADLLEVASNARATVVQVMGAQNMSNRLYSVHPRRNDRFINASTLLKTIYREVDFTEFHFTRHLLQRLEKICPRRFDVVRKELQVAWLARMTMLLNQINGPVVLLWMGEHGPSNAPDSDSDPLFITQAMMDALGDKVAGTVVVTAARECTSGMVYNPMEEAAARELMGPGAHDAVAQALIAELSGLLQKRH